MPPVAATERSSLHQHGHVFVRIGLLARSRLGLAYIEGDAGGPPPPPNKSKVAWLCGTRRRPPTASPNGHVATCAPRQPQRILGRKDSLANQRRLLPADWNPPSEADIAADVDAPQGRFLRGGDRDETFAVATKAADLFEEYVRTPAEKGATRTVSARCKRRLNISGAEEDEPAQLGGRLRGSAAGRRCRLAPRRRGLRGQRQTPDWLREDRRQIPVRQRFSGCRCHKAQRNGLLRKATSLGHAKVAGAPVMIAMFRGPVQEGFDQGPSRPWSRARFPLQRAMRERGALVCSVCCCACAAALRHKGALELNICCLMPRSTWFVARGLRHVHEPGQAANAISRQACHACPGVPNKTQTLCSAKLHEDDVNRNIPKHNSYAARVCPKQEQRQQNGSTDKI